MKLSSSSECEYRNNSGDFGYATSFPIIVLEIIITGVLGGFIVSSRRCISHSYSEESLDFPELVCNSSEATINFKV